MSTAGDVNGDGFSDVLVGMPYYQNAGGNYVGTAFCYYGSAAGLAAGQAWSAEPNRPDALFGVTVASAGDVNGDGYSDAVIGAERYDNGEVDEGAAFVYLGSRTGLVPTPAWQAESDQAGAMIGAVASAGDVNGDGYSEVLMGSPRYNAGSGSAEGAAFLWAGSSAGLGPNGTPANADWWARALQANAWFGVSVAAAGDVNGDGFADVLIGAHTYTNPELAEGAAFLWHGSATGLGAPGTPTNADWRAESNQPDARCGVSVASAGDVNRDGFSDVLIGAYTYDRPEPDEGVVFLWNGGVAGLGPPGTPTNADWSAESNQPGAVLGGFLNATTAGDVNGDGFSDVLLSASGYDNPEVDEGAAFVWLGGQAGSCGASSPSGLGPCGTPTTAFWRAEAEQAGAGLGTAVASAGDVNADGFSDILISAWSYDHPEVDEGAAFAWYGGEPGVAGGPLGLGPNGTPANADWMVESDREHGYFARSVASAGDVNGDGFSDALVGDHLYTNADHWEGRAHLFYGNEGDGLDRIPRQWTVSDLKPIHLLGQSDSPTSVRLKALGRTPLGRGRVQLEWEVKPLGVPFDFTGVTKGAALLDTGVPDPDPQIGSRIPLNELAPIPGASPTKAWHWRVRIRGVTGPGGAMSPFFPHSPWLTIQGNTRTEGQLRTP